MEKVPDRSDEGGLLATRDLHFKIEIPAVSNQATSKSLYLSTFHLDIILKTWDNAVRFREIA
jgi:hypothetical protein